MKIIENWKILTTKGFVDISKANGLIGLDLYLREYKIKILDKRLDYYSILNNDYYFVKGYEPVTNKEWLGYKNDKEYDLENDKKYIQMINNQIKFYKENKSYIIERYTRKYISKYIKKITYPIKYKMLEEIKNIIRNQKGINDFHYLKTRKSAHTNFVDIHLVFDDDISLLKAHSLGDKIEDKIAQINEEEDWIINAHLDPYDDSIINKEEGKH